MFFNAIFHKIQMRVFLLLTIGLFYFGLVSCQQQGCLLTIPGSSRCQICSSNLQLDNQGNCKLYTPIEGCLIYNASTDGSSVCSACSQGYLLSGSICLQLIENCASASNVNTCDKCIDGYSLIRFSSCYFSDINNCPSGTLPRTVNGSSFCQQYPVLNCETVTVGRSSCSACKAGYTLINGICFSVQSAVPCAGNSCLCQGYYFSNTCYSVQLSQCSSSADKVYCDLCNDLYYSNNGVCLKFIKNDDINCNLLTSDGLRCAGCNLNYYLSPDFICVMNYQLCTSPCTSCPWIGFSLFNGNCYNEDALCLVYNFTQQTCKLCVQGYNIDPKSLTCAKTVTCLARDSNNFCRSCYTGYQLDTSTFQCVKLPRNCAVMNTSSLICLTCARGARFSNNFCVFQTTNCMAYNNYGYCEKCTSGFVQISRACLPLSANCDVYLPGDQSKCSSCIQGYRISGQQCFIVIEGCLTYIGQNTCANCDKNYLLASGNCIFTDPNCISMDSNGLCQQCKNGFLPSKSKCVYFDPYCLSYDPASMVCNSAASTFSTSGLSLQQQVAYLNFIMQASSASQGQSSAGFSGNAGQGSYTKDGLITSLPFAGVSSNSVAGYDFNGIVSSCVKGFQLVNAQCVRATQNCLRYNQYLTCQQCNPGFDLSFDGRCVTRSASTCLSQSGGVCTQAASGYALVSGGAVFAGNNIRQQGANGLIATANSGYFVWSAMNIAWPFDSNCARQDEPGTCLQCTSSAYSIINGVCVVEKKNCRVYSPYGLCMGCDSGFILWGGQCRQGNCNGFDSTTGFCKGCPANFTLSLGLCIARTIANCQLYNGGACTFCATGFYLTSGGLCARMISFCQQANAQTGRCSKCIYGYTIYKEQCIPEISKCQVYSTSLNSCSTCASLYYPIVNSTVCGYLGFYCVALNDNGLCITCRDGFTLINQGNNSLCVQIIQNCFLYDTFAKCTRCNSGYVLQSNRCRSMRCANFTNGLCQVCIAPFVMVNGSCIDKNCDKYVSQACLSCLPRYYLSGNLCILIPDLNCLSYSPIGYCLRCADNYTINQKGICVLSDSLFYGCSKKEYPCTQCAVGYILNGSLCYARRCQTYRSNRDCETCINYYTFEPSQRFCIVYTCSSPSCFESDDAPDGFYKDGKGALQISYCISYNGANCVQCQGYRFPNPSVLYGLCYPYNCQSSTLINCPNNCLENFGSTSAASGSCLATNCLAFDSTGKCLQCADKYQLINSAYCRLFEIRYCTLIDYSQKICTLCNIGFQASNGICRPSNCGRYNISNPSVCLECAQGFKYNSQNNLCELNKCSVVSQNNRSICLSCLLGYIPQNGLCFVANCASMDWKNQICSICNQGYEIVQGIGICKASNCQTYDSNLICTACYNSSGRAYALRSGICVSVDPNCISFDSSGRCLACSDPKLYIAVEDICVSTVQGCLRYDRYGCTACSAAYSLSNGLCSVLYCSNYSSPFKCLVCQTRYQLQADFTCIPKNCVSFDKQNWACTSCEPRFQLVQSRFCFTYNCSNYSASNYLCTRCSAGFTLSSEACLFANCPQSSLLNCPSCVTGFQLLNGVCQAPRANCSDYNEIILVCSKCAPGFNLTALGLCVLVQVPDPYCASFSPDTTVCQRCLPNFNYNSQLQMCQSAFCLSFNSPQTIRNRNCTSCATGFVLDSSGKYCISVYCQSYSLSTGVCSNCIAGTFLSNNVCFALRCANYSIQYPSSPICLLCIEGFNLNGNICQASNCQNFNADYTCQFCATGFALSTSGNCVSTECSAGFIFQNFNCIPANCLNYTNGSCNQCLPGFVPELAGCIADSCLSFNKQYVCLQCRTGFNLTLVNGQYLCVLQTLPSCPRGYYLNGGSCVSINIANCSIVDSTGNNCIYCAENFFLLDNVCYYAGNCALVSYIKGCYKCILGFNLQGFYCVSLNCQNVFPNNTCQSCISGFNLVNGVCKASIYKCQDIDPQGNCLRCMSNFQLRSGLCIAIGCSSYSFSSYVCLSCLPTYYLNGQICILKVNIPNCFTAFNSTFCSVCNSGYLQFSGQCYAEIPFCVNYNQANGQCSICNVGYYLSNSKCIQMPPNCLTTNPAGACTNCASGYLVASGQCVGSTANCRSFDPSTALCLNCLDGYYLTNNSQCSLLPQYCTTADRSGACTACRSGYSLTGRVCVVTISYCLIYNQNNPAYCFQCSQGYYLNMGYSCTILPPFCQTANSLGYCLSCQQGYSLLNSGLCVIPVANCISYVQQGTTTTQCVQCASGYSLTNSYTCSSLPRNCQSINSAGACVQCLNGFSLFGNLCVRIIDYCASYDASSYFCSQCSSGYYLSQRGDQFSCIALPRFCVSADLSGSCTSCLPKYIIYNNLCVLNASILNCLSYDIRTYTCLSCAQGYFLNNNAICTVLPQNCAAANNNGACLSCLQGYQLSGNTCVLFVINCDVYDPASGSCVQCAAGYTLSKDLTTCSLAVTNCLVFNPNGACLQCFSGYNLIAGYCIALPQGCSQLNNNKICIACLQQFTLVQNFCVLTISNCAVYSSSGCSQCNPSYYLYQSSCQPFPSNCASFDGSLLRCVACAQGFTLDPNTYICSKTVFIANCASYNSKGQCIGCMSRYYLLRSACQPYPSYCVNVDLLGNCISCAYGSILQGGSCIGGNGRAINCAVFNSSIMLCQVCLVGYNFCAASGICVLPDPACNSFGSDGLCIECKPAYKLFQGQCLQYPTGLIIAPNGGVSCSSGYNFQDNSCFRATNQLAKLSDFSQNFVFTYSSNGLNSPPIFGRTTVWSPAISQLNEYLSVQVSNGSPQIIFQLGIRGNSQGWVTSYILQFRNKPGAPFICWNACNEIIGNSNGQSSSLLQLYHPIIASQLRIYPVRWSQQISLQLELWIENYQ